ncbi:MAG: hypothetical protein ABIH26_07805 [Candidatus Eisenbacteria bacterium]
MRIIGALFLSLFLVVVIGCGGDDAVDPGGPGDNTPGPETPELSIQSFAREYAEMDSAGYASYLDANYTFELLPEEVDSDDPRGWWDRTEELEIAGRMFNGRYNDQGQKVNRIDLTLQVKSKVVDNTGYPGKPPGEIWYKVVCFVDLKVVVEDPSDPEGIVNFIVFSNQDFIMRPDPSGAERYLVYKQKDQPSINKTTGPAAVERNAVAGAGSRASSDSRPGSPPVRPGLISRAFRFSGSSGNRTNLPSVGGSR